MDMMLTVLAISSIVLKVRKNAIIARMDFIGWLTLHVLKFQIMFKIAIFMIIIKLIVALNVLIVDSIFGVLIIILLVMLVL